MTETQTHEASRKTLDQFVILSKIEKLTTTQMQKIRLDYQKLHNIDGNRFFAILADYLKETTGKHHI